MLSRHNEVAADALVLSQLPVLAQVASSIGDNQVVTGVPWAAP